MTKVRPKARIWTRLTVLSCYYCITPPPSSLGFLSPIAFHRKISCATRPWYSTITNHEPLFAVNHQTPNEEWKNLNRAVRHWETAAASPDSKNDSNVFFQLGTALAKRLDFYEEKQTTKSFNKVEEELEKIVVSFENAVRLERASVEVGKNSANLISALRTLGLFCMRMGRQEECLCIIDEIQRLVSLKMPFCIEDTLVRNSITGPEFEWINNADDEKHVAIRTIGDQFIDSDVIDMVRASAKRYREQPGDTMSSRFTMQYDGNSDIHLCDMCVGHPRLHATMNRILTTKVYPLVRSSFGMGGIGVPETPLCVYDAFVVRYDADKAKQSGRRGASLPLHRDGGLVSVNIALNSHNNDTAKEYVGFAGGGTFFDNLIDSNFDIEAAIQRPRAPGHAVAHRSTERHAGALTQSGIREILVFFVTARQHPMLLKASGVERAFYLKEMAKQSTIRSVRLACYDLAVQQNPFDSEAYFWLGFHMLSHGDNEDLSQRRCNEIRLGISHLETAASLSPCNAQVWAYLGLAYSIRWNYAYQSGRANEFPSEEEEMANASSALKKAVQLEAACAKLGCTEDMDVATALLTLGEIFVRRGKHQKALVYLKQVEGKTQDYDEDLRNDMCARAIALMEECECKLTA